MVDDPATRLVTITNGRRGQARLALAAAEVIDRRRPGSVVFVDLAPLTEPGQVLVELTGALGAPAVRGASAVDAIAGMGRRNRKLVILDNMEHLVDSGAGLAELLGRSPTLRILVTSQEPLRLRAEHVLDSGPSPCRPSGRSPPGSSHAFRRSSCSSPGPRRRIRRSISPTAVPRPWPPSAGPSRGCPWPSSWRLSLASLAPADLQDRLGSGALLELPAASADVPPRQASLRSALEWTTGLLDDGAHSLLGALAVLASPFDLRDAVDLADADAAEAERSLWQLTELHLVERLRVDGRVRFRLADSVRGFLQELDRSTRASDREERAVHWLAGRARRAAAGVDSTEESSWRSWLAEWHTELVRATRAALRLGLVEEALELLTALCPYWRARGPSPADIDLAAAAVSTATALGLEPPVLAEVLVWIGLLGLTFGDPETWPVHQANLERGESLARAHDDRVTLIRAVGSGAPTCRRLRGGLRNDRGSPGGRDRAGTGRGQSAVAHEVHAVERHARPPDGGRRPRRRTRARRPPRSPSPAGRNDGGPGHHPAQPPGDRDDPRWPPSCLPSSGPSSSPAPTVSSRWKCPCSPDWRSPSSRTSDRAASWCAEALNYAVSLPIPILAPYCVLPAVQVLSALGDDSGAAELQGAFAPTLEVLGSPSTRVAAFSRRRPGAGATSPG